MSFIYNMADTWNAIGTTFNGIYMNISNGAGGAPVGAAASRAFRLDSNGTSIFDINITGQVSLDANGAAGSPRISGGNSAVGLYFGSLGTRLIWTYANNNIWAVFSDLYQVMSSTFYLGWSSSAVDVTATAPDTRIYRDAANTLALRNGVNNQSFNVYQTWTDASNYEVIRIYSTSGQMRISSERAGTGSSANCDLTINSARNILFSTNAFNGNWQINTSGQFIGGTDNAYDIGASGANRPRHYYGASWVKYSVVTLASLSASFNSAVSAGVGAQAFVTDLTTASFILNTTAAGGGTLPGPVYSDGTQWLVG